MVAVLSNLHRHLLPSQTLTATCCIYDHCYYAVPLPHYRYYHDYYYYCCCCYYYYHYYYYYYG